MTAILRFNINEQHQFICNMRSTGMEHVIHLTEGSVKKRGDETGNLLQSYF